VGVKKRYKNKMSCSPMLAKLSHSKNPPTSGWIFERKFDGERCIAVKKGRNVRLVSRNNKSMNNSYPEIAEALKKQRNDFIIDGEIVTFEKGVSSFSKLQPRMHIKKLKEKLKKIKVYYYVFDIIESKRENVKKLSLKERKQVLKKTISFSNLVRYTEHKSNGKKYYKKACKNGWEGIIGKKMDSIYKSTRSPDWLKFKCENREEFFVGGFTKPKGSRKGFGALLLGQRKKGKLKYVGKVGTGQGFTEKFLRDFASRLKKLETKKTPFGDAIKTKNAQWIKPRIMVQVAFTEWTKDGKLRHPHFLGIRRDKP
jgi:bifunctional non-homologous end joining protein LigD